MKVWTLVEALFPGVDPGRVGWYGLVVALLLAALWQSPASPAALGRADADLARGDAAAAAQRYDDIARVNPLAALREEALYRAALVWEVDLRAPRQARSRLERLAAQASDPERCAEAHVRIGKIALLSEADPGEAARHFLLARDRVPDSDQAPQRTMLAARALAEGGQLAGARALWVGLTESSPEHEGTARLALAELALTEGDAQEALALYEEAEFQVHDPAQQALARLGAATCLERLGNLDEALAELDQIELPDSVRHTRIEALRARRSVGGGAL